MSPSNLDRADEDPYKRRTCNIMMKTFFAKDSSLGSFHPSGNV
jgi:hypothetical protein